MQFITSGSAAVLEMSLTPICLFVFGIFLHEERWSWQAGCAMVIGVSGLVLLFYDGGGSWQKGAVVGAAAVSWAAASSALGSVLARKLIATYGSGSIAGATTLIGGLCLIVAGLLHGEDAAMISPLTWTSSALSAWLFLVIFGSLVGYTLYVQLLRDIGPTRSGSFAFVSPAIAVTTGAFIASEAVAPRNVIGMALMLLSAAVCLLGPRYGQSTPTMALPTSGSPD
jgi:drug/metabolite transporter (DMT)-like permease